MRYWLALALVFGGSAVAQPYSSWAFVGNGTAAQPIALGTVDLSGRVSTILSGAQLANAFPDGACMDVDNQSYLVGIGSTTMNASVIRVDRTGTILGTITVSSMMTTAVDVTVDTNGDYIILESNAGNLLQTRLYRVDRLVNTITTLWAPGGFFPARAVTVDGATGDYLVAFQGFPTANVLRITPTGTVVTLATTSVNLRGQLTYDWRTGDTILGAWPNINPGAVLLSMNGAGVLNTLLASGLHSGEAVHPDRASAATHRHIVGSDPTTSGIFFVDATTRAITTLHSTASYVYAHVFPDRGRNISVIRQGLGLRDFSISIPADAGLSFVLGLSVSGTTPGLGLTDGRRIPLAIDPITIASVTGQLGPLLTGHIGTLGSTGRAVASLNVAPLSLPAIPVWAVVLTLDPAAPLGIRTITDPALVNL